MRGETDAALTPLYLRDKKKMLTREQRPGPGIEQIEGLCVDAPLTNLPVPTNNNRKNYKKDDGGFSFGSALLTPTKSRGVSGFPFGLSSFSSIKGVTESVSGYNGEEGEDASSAPAADFSFSALAATASAVIASAGESMAASGFSFGSTTSSSGMWLTNKGAESKITASAPALPFGAASWSSYSTPAPFWLSP